MFTECFYCGELFNSKRVANWDNKAFCSQECYDAEIASHVYVPEELAVQVTNEALKPGLRISDFVKSAVKT